MLVIFLVVLWVGALTPLVIRWVRAGSTESSVESFHQRLDLLERTAPKTVEPAYRLGRDEEAYRRSHPLPEVAAPLPPRTPQFRVLDEEYGAFDDDPYLVDADHEEIDEAPYPLDEVRRAQRIEQRRRRRRFTLVSLGLMALGLFIGIGVGIHVLLVFSVLGATGLCLVVVTASARERHGGTAPRATLSDEEYEQGAEGPFARFIDQDFIGPTEDSVTVDLRAERARRYAQPLPAQTWSHDARSGLPGAWDDEDLYDDGLGSTPSLFT